MEEAIDVSTWDASKIVNGQNVLVPIDWQKARDQSRIRLAIIKVSQGLDETRSFQMQWKAAEPFLPRIGYHYFDPTINAIKSALEFVKIVRAAGFRPEYDDTALDAEDKPFLMFPNTYAKYIGSWMYEVEKALGKTPYLYAGYYSIVDDMGAPSWLGRYRLWFAQYPFDGKNAPLYDAATLAGWKDKVELGILKPGKFPSQIWPAPTIWQMTARCKPSNIAGYPTGPGTKLAVDWNLLYFEPPVLGAPTVKICKCCGQVMP